jgi:Cyanobacterial TRADD-N associated 2-Transmembrane domain
MFYSQIVVIGFIIFAAAWASIFLIRTIQGRGQEYGAGERAELTARVLLIGVVAITMLMFFVVFLQTNALPDIPLGILTLDGIAVAIYIAVQATNAARETRLRVADLQRKSLDNPDNIKYAWDLAAAKLEDYLNRNLSQVKWIFIVAVFVMSCGFVFVLYGVRLAIHSDIRSSLVAALSGIITQFIGVTFMVIYRSTMDQASSYMVILEGINNIGMAVQILEKMPDASAELQNATRAEIVRSLAGRRETIPPSRTATVRKSSKPLKVSSE